MAMIPLDLIMRWLAWILLHFVWQGAVTGGLLWIALKAVDVCASRTRYGLACGALLVMAISPLVTGCVLSADVRPLPQQTRATITSEWRSDMKASSAPTPMAVIHVVDDIGRPPQEPISKSLLWTEFFREGIHRWSAVLVAIWFSGVVLFGTRLMMSFHAVRELRRSALLVTDPQLVRSIESLTNRLGLRLSVQLMHSASVCVPLVLGWLRPVILIPISLTSGLTFDQVEAVLAHELAHIKRHDYLVNLIQSLVETLLFYHPTVWWVSRTIRDEREHCCDAIALQVVGNREVYAKALFELARQCSQPVVLTVAADGGSLTSRIRRILGLPAISSTVAGPVVLVLAGLSLGFVIGVLSLFHSANTKAEDRPSMRSKAANVPKTSNEESADEQTMTPTDEYRCVTFVVAKHLQFHRGQIVSWDEIEKILDDECAAHENVRPEFLETNGGHERTATSPIDRIYKRLYDAKKIDLMNRGVTTPRASARYDRIKTTADLVSDESVRRTGRVVDSEEKPLRNAEIFLLPKEWQGGLSVYLLDGRLRDPEDEHVAYSDGFGRFETYVEPDEELIAAIHPHGFAITTLTEFESEKLLRLQPWARIHGHVHLEDGAKQSVNFTANPMMNVAFNLYETPVAKDGTFDQKFLPPGQIVVQRGVSKDGRGYSFSVSTQKLNPGESAEVDVGPIPDEQKMELEELDGKRRDREQFGKPMSQLKVNDNNPPVPTTEPRPRVTFVLAEHVQLHETKIVTWDEIEQILSNEFDVHGKVRPMFISTLGAQARQDELNRKRTELYRRLHEGNRIDGMVSREVSARTSRRYDRIRGSADLVANEILRRNGEVLDSVGHSVADAEVVFLPRSSRDSAVSLRLGRLRDAYDEHVVRTDSQGKFSLEMELDEVFVAAIHETGFSITTLKELEKNSTIRLQPWARLHGTVADDPDEKQSIAFTSEPLANVRFQIWENNLTEDRAYDQRFVAPGTILVHRVVEARHSKSISFVATEMKLAAGDSEVVSLTKIPRDQTYAYYLLHQEIDHRREMQAKVWAPSESGVTVFGFKTIIHPQPVTVERLVPSANNAFKFRTNKLPPKINAK